MTVLKRNITFNLIGQFLVMALGFISFKYIYKDLGEDALGIIYFSLMLSVLFSSVLDLGLSKTTVREIAAHQGDDPEYIMKLTQTFSLFYWLIYVLVTTLLVFILPAIVDSWITLSTMPVELAYNVLLVIGVTSLLVIPKTFLSSICIGLQRMDVSNSIDVVIAFMQQLGIVMLLLLGQDVMSVAYWLAVTNILRILVYYIFVSKLLSIDAMLPLFTMSVIYRIKYYTSRMLLASLVLVIHKQLDKVLISKLLPIGILGIYSFVYTSMAKTSLVTGAIAQAAFPDFTELEKKGQPKKLLDRFFTLQDFLIFGSAPIFSAVIFFTLPLFTFLLDESKAEEIQLTVLLLSISFYLNAVLRLVRTYMFAVGKPGYIIKSDILSLFVVLPVSVLLIIKMGMEGAAIAWIFFYLVCAIYVIPRVYKREFGRPARMWFKSVLSVMILSSVTYIPFYLLAFTFYAENIFLLVLFFIAATMIYSAIALNMIGCGLQRLVLEHVPNSNLLLFNLKKYE